MSTECYQVIHNNKHVYFAIQNYESRMEASLYEDDKLIIQQTVEMGENTLTSKNYHLKLHIKVFKDKHELFINGEPVAIQKIKRKELKSILQEKGIHNEINPLPQPPEPINFKRLGLSLILIFIATLLFYIFRDKGKYWEIPSMILLVIAYYPIYMILLKKVPKEYMSSFTASKFGVIFSFITAMMSHDIIRQLINTYL